ncbi:T-box transcription factor TBX22 [Eudromia elegans]
MALSARAHAFSVEALVGRAAKRKGPDEEPARDAGRSRPEGGGAPCAAPRASRPVRVPAEKRPKAAEGREAGGEVQVELQGAELWRRFHDIGTEMIITKAGRRMFPSVRVRVKGLEPRSQYSLAIDVVPVDSKRYRYVYHSSQWMVAGSTEHAGPAPRLYVHPDSPCSGETWMRQVISFDRVKLTNNDMDDKGHIILQSMHKYRPRVHVIARDGRPDGAPLRALPAAGVRTFSFGETEFTTVTAYQNQQITKLKIDRNPFAKGFRDPGRNRGVLDGLLETLPWRPPLALDFQPFGAQSPGGSSSASAAAPGAGPPSPLHSLLPPSCSPPAVPAPDALLHGLGLPLCYRICPASFLRPLVLPGPERPPFVVDVPKLSSIGVTGLKNGKSQDLNGQCLPAAGSGSQVLYGLQASGSVFPSSPIAREALSCSLHPPYGLYGYNLAVPARLVSAASHAKGSGGPCSPPSWQPPIDHCL